MASNQLLPSVLGNVVAARERLSAVRQRMGLEPQGTQMRQLAPTPPGGADMDNKGAQVKTASSTTRPPRPPARPQPQAAPAKPRAATQRAPAEDFDEDQIMFSEDLTNRLLGRFQAFIDENNNGIDDRKEAATPAAAATGRSPEELANIALNPFRDFYSQNKRLPTLDEMKALKQV